MNIKVLIWQNWFTNLHQLEMFPLKANASECSSCKYDSHYISVSYIKSTFRHFCTFLVLWHHTVRMRWLSSYAFIPRCGPLSYFTQNRLKYLTRSHKLSNSMTQQWNTTLNFCKTHLFMGLWHLTWWNLATDSCDIWLTNCDSKCPKVTVCMYFIVIILAFKNVIHSISNHQICWSYIISIQFVNCSNHFGRLKQSYVILFKTFSSLHFRGLGVSFLPNNLMLILCKFIFADQVKCTKKILLKTATISFLPA